MADEKYEADATSTKESSEAKMADTAKVRSAAKVADDNCEADTAKVSSQAKMADNYEADTAKSLSDAMMVDETYEADTAKVFELLDQIVLLNKIQRIRDLHTTPDCSAESLYRLIIAKEEKDRQVARSFRELVALLLKPRRKPNHNRLFV